MVPILLMFTIMTTQKCQSACVESSMGLTGTLTDQHWFSVSEIPGLVGECFGAVGTGSIFRVVQHLVPLR